MKKAGIIGGSQFIGTFITLKFLSEDFRVKVQVSANKKNRKDVLFENLISNQNLEISKTDLANFNDYQNFIKDCEIIVHCGYPFQLDVESSDVPIFVPQIRGTSYLFNALQENTSVKKVIFITSVMALNPYYTDNSDSNRNKIKENVLQINKAKYHAEKAANKMLENFPANFFDIIYVLPVEVKNQLLSNSADSTSLGLQFLFRKKITPDPFFQKLLGRQVIGGLTNIEELPESVYQATNAMETGNKFETKNGQFAAHF